MATDAGITREEARTLMNEYLTAGNLRKHSLATEAIMRELARRQGKDEELWGIAGLLHDLDFEATKDDISLHTSKTAEILRAQGVSAEIIEAIRGHNAENLGYERTRTIDHALTCAESMTGMVIATTLVYPDKKLARVKPASIIRKDEAEGICEKRQQGKTVPID